MRNGHVSQDMVPYEKFNLGSAVGEQPITFQVGHAGTRVALKANGPPGELVAFLGAAQARELAAALTMMADNVAVWEGVEGNVRKDAFATPPSIAMRLPSGGKL